MDKYLPSLDCGEKKMYQSATLDTKIQNIYLKYLKIR